MEQTRKRKAAPPKVRLKKLLEKEQKLLLTIRNAENQLIGVREQMEAVKKDVLAETFADIDPEAFLQLSETLEKQNMSATEIFKMFASKNFDDLSDTVSIQNEEDLQ